MQQTQPLEADMIFAIPRATDSPGGVWPCRCAGSPAAARTSGTPAMVVAGSSSVEMGYTCELHTENGAPSSALPLTPDTFTCTAHHAAERI